MRDQQVVHIVCVLLLHAKDALKHDASCRIVIAKIANELAIMIDRDAFGDEVLADHTDKSLALGILRRGSRCKEIRIESRLSD